jgi:hypothetical protein
MYPEHPAVEFYKEIFNKPVYALGHRDASLTLGETKYMLKSIETNFMDWRHDFEGLDYKQELLNRVEKFNQACKTYKCEIFKYYDGDEEEDRKRFARYFIGFKEL